ncbi:MAG: CoA transferase [Desulfobacterium sp.]|jgi:crotonobetainyl-CoA:carnitine CoA-transferase CaiB-like acyl-CoA transferase|nr:CoA transferase [Desulfobacterium sp.]
MEIRYHDRDSLDDAPLPLEGIKVVEYGVFHAGPGGGAILGDLGADVIKVEDPVGDGIRYWTKVGAVDMAGPDGRSMTLKIDPCVSADRSHHSPLRNVFCCGDGQWVMCTHHPEEKYWKTFCRIMGVPELALDPEYTDEKGRPG